MITEWGPEPKRQPRVVRLSDLNPAERRLVLALLAAQEEADKGPKVDDPVRKEEEQKAPQTVPRISGGPELNEAELSEDDDKRPDKK